MKTKNSMNPLRAFIAAGSFAGFLGGWILLAQSGAPAAAETPAVAVTTTGTVPSQAPGLLTTAAPTSTAATASATTPAASIKPISTPVPTATAVKATTTKPKLKTGASR